MLFSQTASSAWRGAAATQPCSTTRGATPVLRHAVVWRKSSLGTDSESGSRFVERVLTVVQTLRLQRRNVLDYMTAVSEASLRGDRAPSLIAVT